MHETDTIFRKGSQMSDPIQHVIVLMMENRSFEQMLGALRSLYPELDGVGAYGKEWDSGMGYYPFGSLPVLHTLAQHFLICDHWFLPRSGAADSNPPRYDQPTVYQRLEQQGIAWKIYHHGIPESIKLTRQWQYLDHYAEMDRFFADTRQTATRFPQYCFIEPGYTGEDENTPYPPNEMVNGEALIAQIYNALRANEALWQSTLFVLLYGEQTGFQDAPSSPGARVPALLISPWVRRGVLAAEFDHTSLLRYVSDKWQLGPLGQRVAGANSFADELAIRQSPRTDTPIHLKPPPTSPLPVSAATLRQHATGKS
jgi:phospholipase C